MCGDNDILLKVTQLEKYLRSVGIELEKKEFQTVLDGYNEAGTTTLDFDTIWNKFSTRPTITDQQVISAFKAFSPDGKINKEELRTRIDRKLITEEEYNYIVEK